MAGNIVDSDSFEQYLISHPFIGKPENLYNAMNYIMQIGGKRLRPKLLLLAYQCCSGKMTEDAQRLALSVETFHNFSLVHDDIMDNAPLRRGKKTVHEEWNTNTAILAGDNLLIKCYELILKTGFDNKVDILREFTTMAEQVCEGQQMDMNLPMHEEIAESDYLQMIRLKTAVLPATALKMGALAAGTETEKAERLYDFGLNLGMAFQLQDDYLDAFGSSSETGKLEGGDILENKRTVLYIHSMNHLNVEHRAELTAWYNNRMPDNRKKVARVRELFTAAGSDVYLKQIKSEFEAHALENLKKACEGNDGFEQFNILFELLKDRKA